MSAVINTKYKLTNDELKFENNKIEIFFQNLYNFANCTKLYNDISYFGDDGKDDTSLKGFLSEIKHFFVLDGGSNDEDFPESYGFFDSLEEVNEWLLSYDIYNYEHVYVFDILNSKKYNVKQQYLFVE